MSDPITILTDVQPPLTLEQLTQQLADLRSKLNTIESKLPFQNMAAITLITDESNMIAVTEGGSTYFDHKIKIDHPLCNNNPKAIVLAVNQADSKHLAAVNIFYNSQDTFWYISTPEIEGRGFEIGIIIDALVPGSPVPLLRTMDYTTFESAWGIAYAGPKWPLKGDRFSVLIFTEPLIAVTTKPGIDTPVVITSRPVISFNGDWHYKFASASGATFEGTVSLEINETSVTGSIIVSDNSKGALVGTLIDNILSLTRDTGLGTVQILQLNGIDSNHFSGTYLNHGQSPDSGTIEFSR